VAEVTLKINGRNYAVACDDGEEAHLERLGTLINQRIEDLVALVGRVDEPRLLVMTSLLIADELAEANARVSELEDGARDRKNGETETNLAAPNILINAAGGNRGKSAFVDTDMEQFDFVLRLNLVAGLMVPTKVMAAYWIEKKTRGSDNQNNIQTGE